MSNESASASRPPSADQRPLQSVDLLQALLEGSPDAIYFKDRESRFVMISKGLARLLGIADPQQAYGKTDRDFFAAEHAEQAMADEKRIMETGEPVVDLIERETWPNGRITWASSTKLPLRDAAGRIVGTFGISRDITARKVAELRLQQAQKDLVLNARRTAVAEFAADVFTRALGVIEAAQIKIERMQRRCGRTPTEAMNQLSGDLASKLENGSKEHQLAVGLCGLASNLACEQSALNVEFEEVLRSLRQAAEILEVPKT